MNTRSTRPAGRHHLIALAAMSLFQGHAWAQDAAAASSGQLERVIISAQKRDQLLQDVPVAVSEVSGSKLQELHIDSIEQLRLLVPSFDAGASGYTVRGVGTSTFSTSIELSVSTVIDDIVLGRPEMALGSFYDIARVEVLRGPQGMLFGKNASAGVVSTVRQQARLGKREAKAFVRAGSNDAIDANATLNLPLGEKAAIRLGGYGNKYDGIVHNVFDGRRFNGNEESGGRVLLSWEPRSDLRIRGGLETARQNSLGMWTPYKTNPAGPLRAALAACGVTASGDNRDVCLDGPARQVVSNDSADAHVDWDLGPYTLSSVTGVRRSDMDQDRDSDSRPVNILNGNQALLLTKQASQEFRLATPDDRPWRWTAGLFWYDLRIKGSTNQTGGLGLAPVPVFNNTVESETRSTSAAVFGQTEFDLTPKLTAIVGARQTHDRVTLAYKQFAQPGFIPFGPAVTLSDATSANNLSWRLGLKYQLKPDQMFYVTASRGYKGPGFNQTAVSNTTTSQVVNPEAATNFELGMRSSFLDRRLQTNLTVFSEEFKDYQAQVLDTSVTPTAYRTINAGTLKSRGIEADITAVLPNRLVLSAALAYLDAHYSDFGYVSCWLGQTAAQGCVTLGPGLTGSDPSGNSLAVASRMRGTITAYYQRTLTPTLEGFVQADASWRSSAFTTATHDPNSQIPAYGLINASIGIGSPDERWRLTLWARNLADKRFLASTFPTPFGGPGDYSQVPSLDAQRRIGASLALKF
jgi:iron complex outermembrane receptor protein